MTTQAATAAAGPGSAPPAAARVIEAMAARRLTLGVAESLTGGSVCARLTEVPGSSRVLRGAVVAYATDLKSQLLGVDADELARTGPVTASVAVAMARGVRRLLGTSVGLGTTGEAGPEPATRAAPGTVFIAVATGTDAQVRHLQLEGGRDRVRSATVDAVLALVESVVMAVPDASPDAID